MKGCKPPVFHTKNQRSLLVESKPKSKLLSVVFSLSFTVITVGEDTKALLTLRVYISKACTYVYIPHVEFWRKTVINLMHFERYKKLSSSQKNLRPKAFSRETYSKLSVYEFSQYRRLNFKSSPFFFLYRTPILYIQWNFVCDPILPY